ncbi:caspase family protein [Corynebacterium comes]|uniref:Caspase domain protein n=1 Tax=Corynebacterium comes TaxID=2675218 RepID=A0A6B8VXJ5_9CORY|nr:caspase family protein [Corynebacterium comes]QGU03426.1 Caspase domain protein [Corynebacterium comes]
MVSAQALHIGLNRVDPAAYAGWEGRLQACENDAAALHSQTSGRGYNAQILLSEDATSGRVFGILSEAARTLVAGDIFVLTYAGHGGRFADLSDDETDSMDETWLLYNREILDDEIHQALAAFASGVRVVVLSDSCHSGTVIRRMLEEQRWHTPRAAPSWVQTQVLELDRQLYDAVRRRTPRPEELPVSASILLISGSQDDQFSMEGDQHGAFTEAVLATLNDGNFNGDYRALHAATVAGLPPDQVPNFFQDGRPWPEFAAQKPFTIPPPAGSTSLGGSQGTSEKMSPTVKVTLTIETAVTDLTALLEEFLKTGEKDQA